MSDTVHLPSIPEEGEDKEMADCTPSVGNCIADGTMVVVHGMNQDHAAGQSRRNQGADFIAESQRLSHMRASETVSYREAQGQRAVNESGSGRTRVESNTPASGQTVGGGG